VAKLSRLVRINMEMLTQFSGGILMRKEMALHWEMRHIVVERLGKNTSSMICIGVAELKCVYINQPHSIQVVVTR
jgi:hypothetical protein